MMGHVFRRWGFKIKVKLKRIGKKKKHFSGLLFFLSILGAGASAVAPVRLGPISVVVCVIIIYSQCKIVFGVLKTTYIYIVDRFFFVFHANGLFCLYILKYIDYTCTYFKHFLIHKNHRVTLRS